MSRERRMMKALLGGRAVETALKWIPRQCRNEHIDGVAISHVL